MNKETKIQNEIRMCLSMTGVVFRQQSGVFVGPDGQQVRVGVPGMSDLLYIGHPYHDGWPTVAWLEVKTATGKPSEQQLNFIEQMKNIGCVAGIVRTAVEAVNLVYGRDTDGKSA